jgi:tRNA(fMet)-specific endonuclease VapC
MLDTNACIAVMNERPARIKVQLLKKSIETVGISVISLYELKYGTYKSKHRLRNQKTLDAFCRYIEVFQWTEECADVAGQIRADLEKVGKLIGPYDLLIAAHAKTTGATLVTANVREFKRVMHLKVVNWSR